MPSESTEITDSTNSKQEPSTRSDLPSDEQVHSIIGSALSEDSGLSPLKGFKMDLSANPGFRKFFYSAHCDCGTAALLSVEVAREKTLAEVEQAIPELTRRLEGRAKSFFEMSCDIHERMRLGPVASLKANPRA